ncbi:twin-arginine translocase TatA/TatE family subunit [Paenibacillus chitinolyticus]|uniref:Sec-independent protein translocase protein TatA n=1 Tax=Paenibacillus chitinolyticus TaxID=79263 RepID=A0A410WUG7_9BACL|nr:twin-arginine translocase TatA/TatE family subunit [Paenibacillus chitinolyticus]MCY9591817.1 twin-arginine translocase TatA/TatE family subunit [Paenibacillus chitinolyticus]MCY9595117.1 twin-arginine translocase TatA/TatE family subunit [Paenibacillus chitinolyticus]QAV17980.1 twin-arginine translocase TatA/TatE family subunit [Paenibacillus chitinolyticus]
MNFFSPWHLLLVVLVALLLFGPSKLPELGRGFGRMFREFKDATNGLVSDEPNQNQAAPARKEVNTNSSVEEEARK